MHLQVQRQIIDSKVLFVKRILRIIGLMERIKNINIFLKVVLAGLLVHVIYFADLPQYKNKAVALRVIFYPMAAALTCVVWWFVQARGKRKIDYPYVIDLCLTFVVTFDLLGNTLKLYDDVWWWDDAMHLLLSIPWVLVAGYVLRNQKLSFWIMFGLVVAYGSTSHIIWELLEYVSFVQTNPVESLSAYRDTMGDLLLSTVGTFVGAYLSAKFIRKYHASRH